MHRSTAVEIKVLQFPPLIYPRDSSQYTTFTYFDKIMLTFQVKFFIPLISDLQSYGKVQIQSSCEDNFM